MIGTRQGAARGQAEIREPGGVIRHFEVVAATGTRVIATASTRGVATLSTSLPAAATDPSESCVPRHRRLLCTQGEEWCPMPPATWRIAFRKLAGPAGPIRVTFVVARA